MIDNDTYNFSSKNEETASLASVDLRTVNTKVVVYKVFY